MRPIPRNCPSAQLGDAPCLNTFLNLVFGKLAIIGMTMVPMKLTPKRLPADVQGTQRVLAVAGHKEK